ncbi:MAG: type IV secretion system protein [Proteobacteria bacterium]|nr:type IV secretion system protein [Pseudomonadota bacterium]
MSLKKWVGDFASSKKTKALKSPKNSESSGFFKRLFQYFFGSDNHKLNDALKEKQLAIMEQALVEKDNPYLVGYATYIGMYADQEEKSAYHKRVNRFLLLVIAVLAFALVVMAGNSKVQPYVVGVNENGQVFDMNQTVTNVSDAELRPKLAKFFLQDFIRDTFSISVDNSVMKVAKARATSMAKDGAYNQLQEYFKQRNIDQIASKDIVEVKINNILDLSPDTTRVFWTEVRLDAKSKTVMSRTRYVGEFSYSWDVHATEELVQRFNPLGFYIYNFTYSKDITNA